MADPVLFSIAVSPTGDHVDSAGVAVNEGTYEIVVVAFDQATGNVVWTARPPSDGMSSVAVSPDGYRLFFTGCVGLNDSPRYAFLSPSTGPPGHASGRRPTTGAKRAPRRVRTRRR